MVRQRKRVTNWGSSKETLQAAADDVKSGPVSIRTAAKNHGVNHETLRKYMKKSESARLSSAYQGTAQAHMVFTREQEEKLAGHIKAMDDRFHGLSVEKCKELAFEYAQRNELPKIPPSWFANKQAGRDWFENFRERNELRLRKPEATSLARQTAFNRHVVNEFFNNLAAVYDKYKFKASDIYNMDESGFTTVQTPSRVVSSKGKRQVGSTTSQERGELTTLACTINAAGTFLPPFFIFRRVKMNQAFLIGAPPDSEGVAAKTGWMSSEIFAESYLPFVIARTKCSVEKPCLLILDNHVSHVSLEAVELAKASGIVLLTLPPHTSHRLQPLDRAVYGPMKTFYNRALDGFMRTNAGRPITIYNVASLCSQAFEKSMTPENILSAFRATGIHPFNRDVFPDHEFIPADVMDRPAPDELSSSQEMSGMAPLHVSIPTSPLHASTPTSSSRESGCVTPEAILPLPKAAPRKTSSTKRKRVKSAVLTNDEEIDRIRAERLLKESHGKKPGKRAKKVKPSRPVIQESSSSDDGGDVEVPVVDTDDDVACDESDDVAEKPEESPAVGKFVLVAYSGKRSTKGYVGMLTGKSEDGDWRVNFYSKAPQGGFVPQREESYVDPSQIVKVLPNPTSCGTTARTLGSVQFGGALDNVVFTIC